MGTMNRSTSDSRVTDTREDVKPNDGSGSLESSSADTNALKSRTVNDFDTERSLRIALKDSTKLSTKAAHHAINLLQGVEEAFDEDFDSDLEDALMKDGTPPSLATKEDGTYDPNLDWVIANLDRETSVEQSLDEELTRLKVLRSYLILDEERESTFERLTALASRMFHVPIALVSLVDLGRQWFMSNRGLGDVRETPRKLAFCAHAILSTQDLLIVPDATKDPRFHDSALVTGPPYIRFYAGAPLITPEGVKIGTFCIIDTLIRPAGLTFTEKQNLRELAAMVVDTMVQRRREKNRAVEDKSKLIACTAHDLLTPLSGVQMSLSLLREDGDLMEYLDGSQRELIDTAGNCSDVMSRICHETIEAFRGDVVDRKREANGDTKRVDNDYQLVGDRGASKENNSVARLLRSGRKAIRLSALVNNISMVMDPYPKSVPLYITVDPSLPKEFVSDDLKVFRSIINYLTNACKHTPRGCVHLKICLRERASKKKKKSSILFEVEDTGTGIPVEQYASLFRPFRDADEAEPQVDSCIRVDRNGKIRAGNGTGVCSPDFDSPGLGLYSVANNVGDLGGEYGFRPRNSSDTASFIDSSHDGNPTCSYKTGSIFWFAIPLIKLDEGSSRRNSLDRSAASLTAGDTPRASEPAVVPPKATPRALSKKVIICGDGSSTKRAPISPAKRKLRLCRGTWDNRSRRVSLIGDNEELVPTQNEVAPKRSSLKVLSTANLNETDASVVFDVISSALTDDSDDSVGGKLASSKRAQPRATEDPPTINGKRQKKALVIDDSLVIRKSIARALATMGFEVSQATNGMEGLEQLQSAMFDVVFCDFLMPVMDGLDCVQQYRSWEESHRPWLRQYIIGISAHANPRDVERGIKCGMNTFLSKPLPLKVLKELQNSEDLSHVSRKLDEIMHSEETPPAPTVDETSLVSRESAVDSVASQETSETNRPYCLIAEDSKSVSKILSRAVEGRNWRTCTVSNGEEALRSLKMRNWDAVLVDDEMPLLNGSECIKHFREWEKDNRVAAQRNVFFLSGNVVPPPPGAETSCSVVPEGFNGAVPKPVILQDLYNLLDKAVPKGENSSSDIMHR